MVFVLHPGITPRIAQNNRFYAEMGLNGVNTQWVYFQGVIQKLRILICRGVLLICSRQGSFRFSQREGHGVLLLNAEGTERYEASRASPKRGCPEPEHGELGQLDRKKGTLILTSLLEERTTSMVPCSGRYTTHFWSYFSGEWDVQERVWMQSWVSQGSFLRGHFDGHGIRKMADGSVYEGQWRAGTRQGDSG